MSVGDRDNHAPTIRALCQNVRIAAQQQATLAEQRGADRMARAMVAALYWRAGEVGLLVRDACFGSIFMEARMRGEAHAALTAAQHAHWGLRDR